jgi:hypothetical protein
MERAMIAALSLWLSLAAPAAAAASPPQPAACRLTDDPTLRARIGPLLGVIDRPVTAEQWRRLPVGAREFLQAFAADSSQLPTRRAMALEGATALGADETLHLQLAHDTAAPFVVRHKALRSLGVMLAPARRGEVLAPFLTADPDPAIRIAAAETLADNAPVAGCAAVRAQVQREGTVGRLAFRRALAACGEP